VLLIYLERGVLGIVSSWREYDSIQSRGVDRGMACLHRSYNSTLFCVFGLQTVTANNAVMKLRMYIQQMELFVQPLWVSIIGVLAFAWASKAATRWSRGKIPGCQAFYNGTSVSQMIWVPMCCNPCVDYIAVHYCRLK